MNKVLVGILLMLLTACAASGPTSAKLDKADVLAQLGRLPGAQVVDAERIVFAYPDAVLFQRGAVLPLPGGSGLLEPLAGFFRTNTGLTWNVEVRAATALGSEYDLLLARKRSELLERYLLNSGVSLAGVTFNPLAAEGHPLVFTLNPPLQAE